MESYEFPSTLSGAFYTESTKTQYGIQGGSPHQGTDAEFDASRSNPIYGASDTVQPPAHIVVFWKRIE